MNTQSNSQESDKPLFYQDKWWFVSDDRESFIYSINDNDELVYHMNPYKLWNLLNES